jgi:integrase
MMLKRAARRAGIGHVSSHDLRKFFDSHMKLGIEDAVLVDWWMGHNLDKIKRTYSIPHWERQLEEYKKGEREISLKK